MPNLTFFFEVKGGGSFQPGRVEPCDEDKGAGTREGGWIG